MYINHMHLRKIVDTQNVNERALTGDPYIQRLSYL